MISLETVWKISLDLRYVQIGSIIKRYAFRYASCKVIVIFTVRNVVAARLCFHRHLWFCDKPRADTLLGRHPSPRQTPPGQTTPPQPPEMATAADASYWNAFLLMKLVLSFSQNFLSKAWIKKSLIDNHYITVFESVRSVCSSYTGVSEWKWSVTYSIWIPPF